MDDFFQTDTPPVLDAFSTPSMWYRANGIAAGAKRQRNVADYIPQLIRGVPPEAIAQAEKEDAQAKKAMDLAQGFASELESLDPKQLDEMLKVGQAEGKVTEGRKAPVYQEPKMKGPGLVEMLLSALGASANPRFAPQILAAPFEAEVNAYGMRKQDAQNKYERETHEYDKQNQLDMQLATLTANMDAKEAALIQRQAESELRAKIEELKQEGMNERSAASLAQREVALQVREAIAAMQDETKRRGQDINAEAAQKRAEALEENRKFYRELADRQLTRATDNDKKKWSESASRLAIAAGHLSEAKQRTAIMGQALGISAYNAAVNGFRGAMQEWNEVQRTTKEKMALKAILGPLFDDLVDEIKVLDPSQVPQAPKPGTVTAPAPNPALKGPIGNRPIIPKVPTGTPTFKQKPKQTPKPNSKPPPGFQFDR